MTINSHDDVDVIKSELEHLRQAVSELQTDRENDRIRIESLKLELSACIRYVISFPAWKYTKEELEKWGQEVLERYEKHPEEFFSFADIMVEIEKHGPRDRN